MNENKPAKEIGNSVFATYFYMFISVIFLKFLSMFFIYF